MTLFTTALTALAAVRVDAIPLPASGEHCSATSFYERGSTRANVCAEDPGGGITVLDFGDDWAPRIFSETADHPQPYRQTFVALANERIGTDRTWDGAARDLFFELYGIFPSLGAIRRRLLDEDR